MKYIVPIVYHGQSNFTVEADSFDEAQEKASAAFRNGDEETVCGNEWEEIERVGDPEPA